MSVTAYFSEARDRVAFRSTRDTVARYALARAIAHVERHHTSSAFTAAAEGLRAACRRFGMPGEGPFPLEARTARASRSCRPCKVHRRRRREVDQLAGVLERAGFDVYVPGRPIRVPVEIIPPPQLPAPLLQLPAPARRRRQAPRRRRGEQTAHVEATVEALERDPFAVPQPIGGPGYRPAQCSSLSDVWGTEYAAALDDARERASIEAGEDDAEFRRLLRTYFEEHPEFPRWASIERECVADFRRKHPKRKRRTETASTETRRALEDLEREMGESIRGTPEHLDRLTASGQAAYWRREYKRTGSVAALQRAREIERRARASKKRGAGVKGFRAG